MRLSTAPQRDDERAIAVLHAAFAAGVTLLDTANAYCHDESDVGHNERLIARALATWRGDAHAVRIATKGGLTRPNGQWIPDGRARALTSACEASLRALNLARIPLYQLHAPDPRVALSTSVRALRSLQRDGLIDAIGLCNVTVSQIEQARRIAEIASVQVELSIWDDEAVLGGVFDYCAGHGIQLLAYRPLGGPERRRRTGTDPVLADLAAARGATPFEIALAALASFSPNVVPLPGPSTPETAVSSARAASIELTAEDRATLAQHFPACRAVGLRSSAPVIDPSPETKDEVVIVMGLPAAGKSTVAKALVADGYTRMNRDEAGGSLRGLLDELDAVITSGHRRLERASTASEPAERSGARGPRERRRKGDPGDEVPRIVLDNTYVTRAARGAVLQAARQHGLPVRCVWLTTSVDDAQVNAVTRIVSRYGRLLDGGELKTASRQDVAAFGPAVQFRYQRELEPPDVSEGFSRVDIRPFERRPDPSFDARAVIVWCDGVLLRSRSGRRVPVSASDVEALVERGAMLRRHAAEGWKILGTSWLPEIADRSMSVGDADAVFARLGELLGVEIEVEYCPHPAGPPTCWCRKPLPGLGVVFIQRHRLDPSQCIYVGSGSQDPGFARKLGFRYREADEFFGPCS